MTTPGVRFVAIWTALSVAAHALTFALASMAPLRAGHAIMLLAAIGVVATPVAQAIALRTAAMRWAREWAVAGIAGALFARIAADILRRGGAGGITPLVYSVLTLSAIAVLQFIVLRRHGARAPIWLAAAAAVWAIERAGQWLITGGLTPGPAAPPLSRTMALSLTAATALLEGIVLASVVLRRVQGPEALARRGAGPGWQWIEWTAGGALALVTVMGAAGLVENVFRESPRAVATSARPLLAVVAGLIIGTVQWLLLRRYLARPGAWLVASMAALAVPALALPMLGMFGGFVWLLMMSMPGGIAALGAWFGFCQWLVLRRHAAGALLWILATAVAWAFHYFTLPPIGLSFETAGAAAGAVMAAPMFALRHPVVGDVRPAPSTASPS